MKKLITDQGKEIEVDNKGIMITKYGKPFRTKDGNDWKLVGYAESGKYVGRKWLDDFEPDCIAVFFDASTEGSAYELNSQGCVINHDLINHFQIEFYEYRSRQITKIIDLPDYK